jgi:hypothetical protein
MNFSIIKSVTDLELGFGGEVKGNVAVVFTTCPQKLVA